METSALRSAYEELFALAESGEFAAELDGEWTAELILAHIAANDELLSAATEAVLADAPQPYEVDEAPSSVLVAGADLAGLISRARSTSSRLCELAERLGERDNTWVHTRIQDGAETIVDQALPWARTLDIHARVHLPLHLDQLRALSTP